jgi:hypothetical protein
MQLLLVVNDRRAIDREFGTKARTVAPEACCVPCLHDGKEIGKQTSNDEGRARDLQIEVEKRLQPLVSSLALGNSRRVTVDDQDNGSSIERYPGHSPELKWNK